MNLTICHDYKKYPGLNKLKNDYPFLNESGPTQRTDVIARAVEVQKLELRHMGRYRQYNQSQTILLCGSQGILKMRFVSKKNKE
jgi:hypothetical protein